MILLNGSLDRTLQPSKILLLVGMVELIVDFQGHVGKERRLRTAKVITSVSVQDLKKDDVSILYYKEFISSYFVVMPYLKDEMVDHTLSQLDLPVNK